LSWPKISAKKSLNSNDTISKASLQLNLPTGY
jgi:hypothetical protein